MKNITLAIDEDLLGRARSLAEARHTTLNAMVRSLLANEVEQEDRIAWAKEGMRKLIEEKQKRGESGPPFTWNRDEIYAEREDRMLSRLERPPLRGFGEEHRDPRRFSTSLIDLVLQGSASRARSLAEFVECRAAQAVAR